LGGDLLSVFTVIGFHTTVGQAVLLVIVFFASLGVPCRAVAEQGDGGGVGPVVGYSGAGSWSLGWEASVSRGFVPVLKLSAGGSYQFAPRGKDPFTVHYLAVEPWFIVGGTLGLAVADGHDVLRLAYGGWEGFPVPLTNGMEPFGRNAGPAWMLTFAVGIRAFGATSQVYFAPKLWRTETFTFGS